jgi:endonuclease G, mitochondrial
MIASTEKETIIKQIPGLLDQTDLARDRFYKRNSTRVSKAPEYFSENPFTIDSNERILARKAMIDPRDGLSKERILGESDLFPVAFMEEGLLVARSVCRVEVRDAVGRVRWHGTGFMVAPSLMLTNNHVIDSAQIALHSVAQFNYENDLNFNPRAVSCFRMKPDELFITNAELDFTLVAVSRVSADGKALTDFGHLEMIPASGKALLGEYVSIIQHPSGAPKMLAIRENKVVDCFDSFIHYSTDTQPGSSGSPVFNDSWDLVALHHAGVPSPDTSGGWIANEGVRISSIMQFLAAHYDEKSVSERILLDELTDREHAPVSPDVSDVPVKERDVSWYRAANGYNPDFLGEGNSVPLPRVDDHCGAAIAPLLNGETELKYHHFSVVMNAERRLAYFTAVNIDGSQLQSVDRSDRWYYDPRMDKKYQSGPNLYYKNDLDRGHLVRRLDPVWGPMAGEANEDTFHFTNCAPQHKNLNQKTWVSLEDYILDNAGLHDINVTVFTGPVFRSDDMMYRGEYQIPVEFWKVVAFVNAEGKLSATAYLQTQKNLLENLKFAYGAYETYQVPVSKIEELTRLDFGNLRTNDPIANIESTVGRRISGARDIRC